jgi:copper chaperone CopZ
MRFSTLFVFAAVPAFASLIGCTSSDSADATQAMAPSGASTEQVSNQTAPIEASGAVLKVKGMSCPKCANNITLKLKEVQSVQEVLINMGIGEVIVSFGEGEHPSRAQLAGAIDRAGFTLESITTR